MISSFCTFAVGPSSALEHQAATSAGGSQPSSGRVTPRAASATAAPPQPVPDLLGDLLDMDTPLPSTAPTAATGGVVDLLGGLDLGSESATAAPTGAPAAAPVVPKLPVILDVTKGKGLIIRGTVGRQLGSIVYFLELENASAGVALDGFMIQLNKNFAGFAPANQVIAVPPIAPGTTASVAVALTQSAALVSPPPATAALQVAIKCNQLGVLYLTDAVPLTAVFSEGGSITNAEFGAGWAAVPESQALQQQLGGVTIPDAATATAKLQAANIFVVDHKFVGHEEVLDCTGRAEIPGAPAQVLLKLQFVPGQPGVRAVYRSSRADLAQLAITAVSAVLGA